MRKILGVLALSTVFTIGTAVPVLAGTVSTVTSSVACDTATGLQVITWTYKNFENVDATIETEVITTPGLTAGTHNEATAPLVPTVVASLGTATGATHASGNAVGTVTLTVHFSTVGFAPGFTVSGIATLVGGCVAATTTTTTATTTTTTAVAAADGQLPHVGQGTGPLPWIALGLVGTGLALVSVRRRPRRA